jgi:hypothetical protein
MPLKPHRIMAVLLAIGICGALAPGGGRAVHATETSISTVSSGAVTATVTITGDANVSLSTSTLSQDGQGRTCIQIMVDDLAGEFCETRQSGPITYRCRIATEPSGVHGRCVCRSRAADPPPQACAGLEDGCAQFGGEVQETADGKRCVF